MPVVAQGPFPLVENALQCARVICNDAAQSILGNLLADNQPFTLPMCDLAFKTMRKMLTQHGVNSLVKYATASNLLPVATTDPTTQVQLMYSGYFDGVQNWASPTLPSDMIEPLEVWERAHVSVGVNTSSWQPVTQAADSISTRAQVASFRIWDWENNILFLPGAVQPNDLKFKYLIATPRLISTTQQIPIVDCEMAMGALIAELLSMGRGGAEATAQFHARAEAEVTLLANPTAQKDQFASYNRRPFRATRAGRRRR
jgi:hypothetical protein